MLSEPMLRPDAEEQKQKLQNEARAERCGRCRPFFQLVGLDRLTLRQDWDLTKVFISPKGAITRLHFDNGGAHAGSPEQAFSPKPGK